MSPGGVNNAQFVIVDQIFFSFNNQEKFAPNDVKKRKMTVAAKRAGGEVMLIQKIMASLFGIKEIFPGKVRWEIHVIV